MHLPPIEPLEIPKRPPSVLILGANGATLATRGDMGGAAVPLAELPAYVPNAFVAIEDRRFYSHFGIDPLGIFRAIVRDVSAPRRLARRLDIDAATRQESVPDAGAHAVAQGAGGGARALARAQILQEADPRSLSQPRLFRRRRLRRRRRGAALFRQIGAQADARRSRDAGRPRAIAVAACAQSQSRRRASAAPRSCSPTCSSRR